MPVQEIPTIQKVRGRLTLLTHNQLQDLSEKTGVPFGTLMKIRRGETANPGLETVRSFWPVLEDIAPVTVGAACER